MSAIVLQFPAPATARTLPLVTEFFRWDDGRQLPPHVPDWATRLDEAVIVNRRLWGRIERYPTEHPKAQAARIILAWWSKELRLALEEDRGAGSVVPIGGRAA